MERYFPRTAIVRRSTAIAAATIVVALFSSSPADAQWLKFKTPGIPRTADGKPNLSAPTPRTPDGKPDLSGLWRADPAGTAETGKAEDAVKALPWAEALTKTRKETIGKDSPSVLCLPPGPVVDMGVGRIVQAKNILVMLWGGTLYREIFLDGRELPKDPNPDWMGYSVGHWEGDTLVIESIGFNDRTWLDDDGHPHTEALRVTERIHRSDYGHMEVIRTLVDPGALAEPWTVPVKLELYADTEPLEYVCNENERDRDHLVGKTTDEKGVDVAPAILQKYVGNYELTFPATGQVFTLIVSLKDDRLVLGGMGPSEPLLPVSQTEFTGTSGTTFNFVTSDAGAVTQMNIHAVEGDFKAVRK
jgi:hypothetical protein